MTKYIVSGYIGFDNFGDEAIQKVLTEKLKKEGAEKITLISSNPSKTSRLYNVESCGMLDFIKHMVESDVLISGGGSLLQDVTSLKSLIYYLGVIYTAFLFNKKVEIFAQGIGPINSKIGQFFTKFALKQADKISVRDEKSQKLLKQWGIESELVNDPILDLDLKSKNKQGKIGVQLREFKDLNEDFMVDLAEVIKNRFYDKEISLISLQDAYDVKILEKFKKILADIGVTNVKIKKNLNVNDVIEEILDLEFLIAMRFHACVIGAKAGIDTICINYDPKVESLAQRFNLKLINLSDNVKEIFKSSI